MRSTSVARQFTLLIAAFAVAMPAAVFGMATVLYRNFSETRAVFAEGNRQSDALFALIGTVGKAQGQEQRLLRQKDPDEIERILDQAKAASRRAGEMIQRAGGGGDAARVFDTLEQANQKSQGLLLQGEAAQAQEVFMSESNPAFENLLDAIGALQADENRREEAEYVEQRSLERHHNLHDVCNRFRPGLKSQTIVEHVLDFTVYGQDCVSFQSQGGS
jgi:hypothetical protein